MWTNLSISMCSISATTMPLSRFHHRKMHYPTTSGFTILLLYFSALLVMALLVVEPVNARPAYESWSMYKELIAQQSAPGDLPRQDNECGTSSEVQTLCQQCAKSTKSILVYPMCCGDLEEARPWCVRYVNFGTQ